MGFIALERARLHYVFENIFHVVERLVSEKEAKMNKIFKVIWSKSKQCYVVVSEMAKNTTGKKKIVVAGILASLMMQPLATMDVDASASFGYSNKKGSISINGHSTSNATASEENAIAIGQNSNASGRGGISLGNDTSAAWNAFAGGWNAKATGKGAVALGQATANSESAIALGTDTSATANSATAIGNGANASKSDAIAVGTSAAASESNSIALGKNTQAKTSQAIAVGEGATADGTATIAIGAGNSATGWGATAIGKNVQVTKERSTGLGWDLTVDQSAATLVGYNSQVHANQGTGLGSTINITSAAQYGTGIGYQVDVSGKNAVAIGSSGDTGTHTTASATDAVSIGTATVASGEAATAIGKQAAASGSDAVSIGTSSKATGSDSLALGKNANASNSDSIAIGQDSVADSINGVALGKTSKATGSSATALGPQSTASGTYSTAIGMNSVANKEYAIAIGGSSQATVERGVALGTYSIADTASGVSGYDANTNRTNKYAGLTGKALTSTWGAVSIGDSTNTRQITGLAAGTKDTDAVNVAQLKSVNLAFTGDNSSSGDVNLANSKLAITGDTTYITTTAASQGIAIKGVKKDITVSNGTASASAGMADAKNVAEAINQANADQKITYKANSGTTNSVKLSDGLNFTNGTSTVATVGNNGQVTYDLNAATKKSIADSETAVKRTISLGADSGTRSSQSLNDNNVDFNVKGSSGSYITTSMAGNTVTINTTKGTIQSDASGTASLSGADGLATAQNVATAINQAKEGSAWNLAVNSGAAQKVSGGNKVTFKDGKNISLTQTGTTITVGTTDQLTADNVTVGTGANQIVLNGTTGEVSGKSIKAGNTIMNTSGLTISGGPSVTSTGINAGNKVISGVSQAVAGTDAVNKNQMDAAVKAVADSTSELGKNTITLATQSGSTTGQTLNSATGIKFYINGESGSDALISTSASGTNVSVAATQKLKDAVTQAANAANKDLSNLSTAGDTHIKGLAKTAATWNVSTNGSNNTAVAGGETVNFINGDNIAITNTGRNITIGTAKNVSFDKVTVGGVTIDKTDGINAGGKAISNVGTGRVSNSSTDDGNVANIGDVKAIANDAVSNLSTSLGVTDGTNSGTVNLKNQSLKVVGTGVAKATVNGQTITVDVAKGTLTNNTTTGALIGTAGVVDANDMVTAVNTAITKAVDTATGTQKLDVSAGGTDSSVNLKTQKLTVAGTGAATASLNNQTITVDVAQGTFTNKSDGTTSATAGVAKATDVAAAINNVNTVLSQKITDATGTLGNNTFTLKADSTDTTAQALNKSGGLAFKVAGDGDLVSTSATTDTVNVTVKKGTLSTNTDGTINKTADGVVTADNMKTVVNDAITKAVTSAKDGSAWNISTNGGTATKVSGGNTVDLINGDNIEITQDGTGKKITVKTKKDLTLDSVTAANTVKVGSGTNLITLDGTTGAVSGNTFTGNSFSAGTSVLNTTGFHITGGPSVTAAGIDAGNKQITNLASGGTIATNAATIGDVNDKVTQEINNLTTNLTKNTSISYTANNDTPVKTVSLKDGFKFTNGTLTTAEVAAGGVVKFHVTQGSLSTDTNGTVSAGTTGVATTSDVASAVNSAVTAAVTNATGNQKLDISAGGTDSSVNLKTQKLTVTGTGAATASLNNQTITVDVAQGTFTNKSDGTTSATAGVAKATDVAAAINNVNTVLSQKITDATGTLGNNTFTLKADSTDTTAQALNKSGGLAFKVAGDGDLVSTSATTDTVNVTVKKGTLSTNTDGTINKTADGVVTADNMKTVVNDAITKAVTSAKDGSAWNISTNGGTATKVSGGNTVDLINGDNIEITQDGTGKKITVKTKKDLTLDSVTAANTVKVGSGTNLITLDGTTGAVSGNTFTGNSFSAGTSVLNTTGFHITGGPSVTAAGIDAGNKQITNLASGGTIATNAATIGDVNDKVTQEINNLTTNLTKNTSISYTANNDTPVKTVSLKDGFKFTNGTLTTAEVAAGGVVKFHVTQGSLSTDTNGTVSAGTTGVATTSDVASAVNSAVTAAVTNATGNQKLDISAGGTDSSVNLKTQKLTVAGTGAATASLNGQTITVDVAQGTFTNKSDGTTSATAGVAKATDVASAINNANTALSQKITDATTSLGTLGNNTFTLKADSTDTTAQALNKSGGLAFKVAGDGDLVSTSATTDTVKVTVKKGELSNAADGSLNVTDSGVVTADNMKTVVNDAITKAVTSAKDGSAWNISTNGGTATKVSGGNTVDLINGDNIEITQDGTDGKKITVKTKKDLTLDSVTAANTVKVGSGTNLITLDGTTGGVSGNSFTAGNASMNTTGFRVTGGPSVTTAGIDAGGKQITNMISGGTVATNAATIGDVNTKVTTAINDLTTNLTKNTNIAYTANTATPGQTVSLKDGFNFTNGTLTTAEVGANGVVKFNVTQGALSTDTNGTVSAGTAGVATTADVASAVNSAVSTAVNNATGNQKLDISAGGTDSSVNLKTQKLTVAGTGAATASLNGQTITVDVAQGTFTNKSDGTTSATAGVAKATDVASAINNANTALSQKITDATTSLGTLGNNTFTLKADSTDTTAQALNKSGGLAFKVAGDGDLVSTSATTDTVKVTVKKGELSNAADGSLNVTDSGVVTADNMKTVVNDAITKAVTSAKDGSAWNISTNGGTATKVSGGNTVDLINGDNIEITQDGTDGKKITVKTKKDLTVDSVKAANTVKVGSATNLITLDGTTGAVSSNTFTAGNASMNTTGFRLTGGPSVTTTGIDAGNTVITNVASGGTTSTNAANIGDITKAISDLTTNLTKNTNISYTANTTTPGQTVSLKDGFNFSNGTLTTAEVAAGGVVKFNVTQGSLSTDGNGNITNTAGVATTDDVKNAVNTAINKAVTNSSAAVNTLGANTFTLTGDNSTSTTGQALNKNGGLSFKVAGDGNFITTSAATDTVTVSIKQGAFGSNTDGTAKSTTNGVATTNDVANIVNTTVTNAVTKATGAQVLNITDGNNNGSINLKNDALKVVGTDGVTTEVSGKTITVGLDTATKDKINNASVATNKNISLAADSGTISSQSLKDGDVSFAVKGATGDYISTNMNGSTVEISTKRATIDSNATTGQASVTGNDGLATAKNVADAINAATAKAVSQSAWKLAADGTTGTETISGGDTVNFKAGSNMEVSRTGKDITYKTKDNVAFTTVTAGTGANEVKLDGNTGTVTAKDITATGDVTAKNVTTSGNVTAAGTVKGDTVQGNTVKAGNVTITGGTTNTITGLSNTTWTPAGGIQADRAATEGQLQQAINQVNATVGSTALTFKGDTNPAQSMTLQGNTFAITGDTMIKTTTNTNGIGLSLDTSKVNIAYTANGLNGQTTSLASGFNFTDGDHTKATVAASGVVKYDAKTSTISVANGHATSSGNDLATADNVADAINQMTQNNSGNTTQLRQEISKVATETQRVGAHAAAMAALKPIQYDPLEPTQFMAGVGNYRGQTAAAIGLAHYTNDNTMFNVGVSVGGNHNMVNAGVTHKFGISAEKKNIPDRYKAGPISSIYVMQDEMTQLRSENEAYKAKLDKQQSEIDALKAAVDQLLASKA